MNARFARAARLLSAKVASRKLSSRAASLAMYAMALQLAADPLEVLRQQLEGAQDPEVRKALQEVLEKLSALRSKAAAILAGGDGTMFMRMEEMFPEGAPQLEEPAPPRSDKAIYAPISEVLGEDAPSAAGESTAGSGFMDAQTLMETLEGAIKAGKLNDEQRKSAEELLQTLKESSPEKKKQIASRLAGRLAWNPFKKKEEAKAPKFNVRVRSKELAGRSGGDDDKMKKVLAHIFGRELYGMPLEFSKVDPNSGEAVASLEGSIAKFRSDQFTLTDSKQAEQFAKLFEENAAEDLRGAARKQSDIKDWEIQASKAG